jgi:hypothetical protein
LHSLNFFSPDYQVQTTFTADPETSLPVLLASGALTVGTGNINVGSSFIGGGKNNDATAPNTVVLGGSENKALSPDGLIL